jgi:hypothetical protein
MISYVNPVRASTAQGANQGRQDPNPIESAVASYVPAARRLDTDVDARLGAGRFLSVCLGHANQIESSVEISASTWRPALELQTLSLTYECWD